MLSTQLFALLQHVEPNISRTDDLGGIECLDIGLLLIDKNTKRGLNHGSGDHCLGPRPRLQHLTRSRSYTTAPPTNQPPFLTNANLAPFVHRGNHKNIVLQFLARGLSISHEIWQISGEIHPEPYKFRCFNKNYSVWWMQERGYDLGFHEIWGHSPLHAPPQTEELLLKHLIL